MEGVSLVKFQIVSLQQAWQHFVVTRLDRNRKFAHRLLLEPTPLTSDVKATSDSKVGGRTAHSKRHSITISETSGNMKKGPGLLIKDFALVKDIELHVQIATKALIAMDELIGDAAGVCEVC